MKFLKNSRTAYVILLGAVLLINGCNKILEENPRSNVTPSAFATQQGLLGGIAGVYNQMRVNWGTEGFTLFQMAGTDEQLMGGSASASAQHAFSYNGHTGSDFGGGFGSYSSINALNGILELGPTTPGVHAATLKAYLGQAQFLRAYVYFYLVRTYPK